MIRSRAEYDCPQFNTTFIAAGIPTTLQGQLPTSLDLPPILLFVIIASAICWLPTAVVVASRLLVNRKDLKIHLYAPLLNSVALVGMSIVLAFDLTGESARACTPFQGEIAEGDTASVRLRLSD